MRSGPKNVRRTVKFSDTLGGDERLTQQLAVLGMVKARDPGSIGRR
jgi:hypothetical protein